VPQKQQSDCWVRNLAQGIEELDSLGHTFGSVGLTMSSITDRATQEIEVAIKLALELGGEKPVWDGGGRATARN